MNENQDAYGQAMHDYFKGRGAVEIAERDDGCIGLSGDPDQYFTEYPDWPLHKQQAIRMARGKVLDIGCGAGRVALHLQQQGLDAMGIDISPLAIKVCKERGLKKAKVMSITQLNTRMGPFDTLLMYGNNFGLFGNAARAKWLLRRFHRMTTPTGRIIAETLDPYQTDDPDHLAYHQRNKARGRMGGQIRLRIRYQRYKTPWFDYLFVSRDEMQQLLNGTGWKIERLIDSEGPTYIAIIAKDKQVGHKKEPQKCR